MAVKNDADTMGSEVRVFSEALIFKERGKIKFKNKINKKSGLMLYWAEGDKTGEYFVALTNTDYKILIYFVSWLRKYFKIDEKRLRCRLYIWKILDENKAKKFWSKTLNIPLNQFTKSYISKSKPKIRKVRHNFGVCRASYGSKRIFKEIKDGIEGISSP